nr:RNA polymerase beta subunit protein a [Cylindrocapsa geminella]
MLSFLFAMGISEKIMLKSIFNASRFLGYLESKDEDSESEEGEDSSYDYEDSSDEYEDSSYDYKDSSYDYEDYDEAEEHQDDSETNVYNGDGDEKNNDDYYYSDSLEKENEYNIDEYYLNSFYDEYNQSNIYNVANDSYDSHDEDSYKPFPEYMVDNDSYESLYHADSYYSPPNTDIYDFLENEYSDEYVSSDEYEDSDYQEEYPEDEIITYEEVTNTREAWKAIAFDCKSKNCLAKKFLEIKNMSTLGRTWVFRKFMNPRTYDLGEMGRNNLNTKLELNISLKQLTLTPKDFLAATDYLLRLETGLKKVDDIDHLKNRRVRTSGELIQIQFGIGLLRLEKNIREQINKKVNQRRICFDRLLSTKALNGALKEFFGTNPLSQFMDQINPLAEITHKRRLSSLGPGGISRDTATLEIRGIHPTHYGRICPIETPEGKNTGLVNSITTYARINTDGLIETPFYKVYLGQVQKNIGLMFLTAEAEEPRKIATADLYVSNSGMLPKYSLPFRTDLIFQKMFREQIEYIGISSIQMISLATSLIPFLEHDDANRALMGSNMQRQAVPVIRPQRAIVGTGLESRTISDSGYSIQAVYGGLITYVSAEKIIICTPFQL